ncbi:MAG: DUF6089 family protein [Bacteroidales bacterium]|nr:DUF6089 family protein [Bacteroidales bacterium]
MVRKTNSFPFKSLITGILLTVFALTTTAQQSEIGAFGGIAFYCGELTDNIFRQVKPAGGLIYRYNLSPRWALKADIIFSKVSGSDGKTNDNYERNLNFVSPISEIGVQVELNFFKLYNATGKNHFTPYIFAGIALFSFNPQDSLPGSPLYNLQSLGTEGQGLEGQKKKYSLTNVAIPFGIGIKATLGRHIAIGAEWGMRYTFTDYLDDVGGVYYDNDILREQRGDIAANLADRRVPTPEHPDLIHEDNGVQRGVSTTKDWYSFVGLTFTVKFGNESKTCDLKNPRKKRH